MAKTPGLAAFLLLPPIFVALGPVSAAAPPQGSDAPETHAILHAKIVVGDGSVILSGRVLVHDGRIVAVDEEQQSPPGARVIDGTGLTVYPGFVDGSVVGGIVLPPVVKEGEPFDPSLAASARMREIDRKGIRPEASALDLLDVPEEAASARRRAGFALALFEPEPATLGGRAALADLSGGPRRETILRADLALAASLEPASGEGYPRSSMGAIAHFRQAILDAQWQRNAWKSWDEGVRDGAAPPLDPILRALEPFLDRGAPVAFEADSMQAIHRVLAISDELGLRPWIVGGSEAHRCAATLAARKVPVLLTLEFGPEPKDPKEKDDGKEKAKEGETKEAEPPKDAGETQDAPAAESKPDAASKPEDAPAAKKPWFHPDAPSEKQRLERRRHWVERAANASVLAKEGVPLVLTTRGLSAPKDFHAALAKAIDHGFPRETALAAVTTTPAELFGAADRMGRVATGRPAYLTVVKGAFGDKDLAVRHVFVGVRRFDFEAGDDGKPSETQRAGRRRPRDASGAEDDDDPRDDSHDGHRGDAQGGLR